MSVRARRLWGVHTPSRVILSTAGELHSAADQHVQQYVQRKVKGMDADLQRPNYVNR